jgi:tetratricopeptide (TPR) repeat protein
MTRCLTLIAMMLLAPVQVAAQNDTGSKTVIGPSNVFLYDGANALKAGDGEEGVALTLKGLELAHGQRETKIGHANLCAGFMMLGQALTALEHCNWVLERYPYNWQTYNNRALVYLKLGRFDESEADIKRGQELNPRSETLKEVKGLYLDEVDPVDERITIDDRRKEPASPVKKPD